MYEQKAVKTWNQIRSLFNKFFIYLCTILYIATLFRVILHLDGIALTCCNQTSVNKYCPSVVTVWDYNLTCFIGKIKIFILIVIIVFAVNSVSYYIFLHWTVAWLQIIVNNLLITVLTFKLLFWLLLTFTLNREETKFQLFVCLLQGRIDNKGDFDFVYWHICYTL